jgi:hypothetical protein
MKTGPEALGTAETEYEDVNMKTGPDALEIAENESGRTKYEHWTKRPPHRRKRDRERKTFKWDRTPSVPPKMSSGAQNMKTGLDALDTAENESGSAKHQNGTQYPLAVRPKMSSGVQNMKTVADALGTTENESGRAKHENGTRRPQNRRK